MTEVPDEPGPGPDLAPAQVRQAFRASLPSWWLVLVGMWLSLVAVALIVLAQLDGLVGQRAEAGRTFSLTAMTSVGALVDRAGTLSAWRTLADLAAQPDGPGRWVALYAWADLGFAVLYGVGVGALLLRPVLRWRRGHWWFLLAFSGLVVGAVSDVSESHWLLALAAGDPQPADLYVASLAKWSGLGVALLAGLLGRRQLGDHPRGAAARTPYGPDDLSAPTGPVGRTLRALYTHRFSLLVVVPFAVLGLASGTDVLDQLPDVQRQWVDDRPGLRLAVAGTLTAVVAVVVVVVGRLRSHHVAMRVLERSAPYRRPALLPWLVTAAVIVGGGLVSWPLLGRWEVITPRFAIAVGVPLLIWLTSLVLRLLLRGAEPPWSPYRRPVTAAQARTTQTVGDVVGILAVVIPGLGLVRAFAAPVALGDGGWNIALLGVGVGVGVLAWPVARLVGAVVGARSPVTRLTALTPGLVLDAAAQRRSRRNGWILLVVGIALFVVIGLFPRVLVERVGVIELVLLAVTAIALPLGATLILLQGGGAPDVLSRSGTPVLATAPVTTLIVLTAVVVGLTGSDARVHGLRTLDEAPPGSSPAERTTLTERLAGLTGPGCDTPLAGVEGLRVRPVFLLAAEGGGIRAAAWTALGADALDAAGGRCAEALMSSGASGGAVGLTVASVSAGPGEAFAGVERMAGPDALGVAVSGLIVRDPLRSVTGVPFPTWGESGWVDRAGLMEREWEQAVPALGDPFLGGAGGRDRRARPQLHLRRHPLPHPAQPGGARPGPRRAQLPDPDRAARQHRPAADPASGLLLDRPDAAGEHGGPPRLTVPLRHAVRGRGDRVPRRRGQPADPAGRRRRLRGQRRARHGRRPRGSVGARTPRAQRGGARRGRHGPAPRPGPRLPRQRLGQRPRARPGGQDQRGPRPAAHPRRRDGRAVLHRHPAAPCAGGVLDLARPRVRGGASRAAVCDAVDAWRGPAVKVFYQPTRPSIAAPLGWVLSDESLQTLRCARDDQVVPAGLPRLSPDGCAGETAVDPEGVATSGGSPAGCADVTGRDDSPLAAKGYGTMRSALCLAREALAATPAGSG